MVFPEEAIVVAAADLATGRFNLLWCRSFNENQTEIEACAMSEHASISLCNKPPIYLV